jgi:copper chaperone CopZ
VQFGVLGNCEMCKESIEEALKESPGIQSADWNVNSKVLTITYDSTLTNLDNIYNVVSTTGYDSDKMKGSDSAYSLLPHCCQYKRKADL